MILTDRSQVLDADLFTTGLMRAMAAVVLVQIEGPSGNLICTGWMLTPGIVVLPEHVIENAGTDSQLHASKCVVLCMRAGRVAWKDRGEELICLPRTASPDVEPEMRVALLALGKNHKMPRLNFSLSTPAPGGFASILNFPLGQPRLSLSLGKLTICNEKWLEYDAATVPGSSGAPVLDDRLQVLAMHMMGGHGANRGVARSAILEMLRQMPRWHEIAKFHRIADVSTSRGEPSRTRVPGSALDEALKRAAVRLNVQRSSFSESEQQALRASVVNPDAKLWTLQPNVRQSVIRSAGSLKELRKLAPRNGKEPGQRVISKILAGPPYKLDESTEEELSWWIQASRWFAGVAPDLPTPAVANRLLQRRRVRSRLDAIAGEDFTGRAAEMKALRKWYIRVPPVPICISGVGGVGKSALVAHFAASLRPETLLLWLDFDRADLAPDDAVSVISSLAEQARVQLDGFTPPQLNATDWTAAAKALAEALLARKLEEPPLLVLDSFEVAQYAERYQELWPVLEEISGTLQALHVIVSGRAPVKSLQLQGRSAEMLPIKGLTPKDSEDWLHRHGIRVGRVVKDVVERSRGMPLVLHLAHRLVTAGGKVSDLPKTLPPEIIAGFLYDRVLDRVQHASLKPLAQGALVLRRLTEDILKPVLTGLVDLPPGEPADWFRDLSREAALVDGSGVLRLRPEVRSAALELLEHEKPALVRSIDQRAVEWYEKQDGNNAEIAAELVYHRLRLGDLKGAQDAWRDRCSDYLQYADEDLDGQARAWLKGRLGSAGVAQAPLEAWEQEAAERIRASRQRGRNRAAISISKERVERSHDSALVFHEAYALREDGERNAALDHLMKAGPATGAVGRERALLQALLLDETGQWPEADAILRRLCTHEAWADRRSGKRELMAVCAARVRMTVDVDAEQGVYEQLEGEKTNGALDGVSPIDVALPSLRELLTRRFGRGIERNVTLVVSGKPSEGEMLLAHVERHRELITPGESPAFRGIRKRVFDGESPRMEEWPAGTPETVRKVLFGGWRRWEILARSPLFDGAVPMLTDGKPGPLELSILGAYSLFVGLHGLAVLVTDERTATPLPLGTLLSDLVKRHPTFMLREAGKYWAGDEFPLLNAQSEVTHGLWRALMIDATPDPLQLLVNRFAGKEQANG